MSHIGHRRTHPIRIILVGLLSIGLHLGLVALGGYWASLPIPITQLGEAEQLGEEVQELILAENEPPAEPEPTPESEPTPEPEPEPTPPPMDKPDFEEPVSPTPTPAAAAHPRGPKATPAPGAKTGPTARPGVVGGNVAQGKLTGTPGGARVGTGWRTPKPIYPLKARQLHIAGSGSVRVTTNASGRVVAVEITGSINPILDSNTRSFALGNWSGPPNQSTVVPITYRLTD
jgi:outer membrane biosynthesis protein TonB